MTAWERAERLEGRATREGKDGPSLNDIAGAINDAEEDLFTEIEMLLRQYGFKDSADSVERLRGRRHDPEKP